MTLCTSHRANLLTRMSFIRKTRDGVKVLSLQQSRLAGEPLSLCKFRTYSENKGPFAEIACCKSSSFSVKSYDCVSV